MIPSREPGHRGRRFRGNDVDGFAPAACVNRGALFVSLADGSLYKLNESNQQWDKASHATPRVAHRLVSNGDAILVIGGADKNRNSDLIEAVLIAN